MRFGFIAFFLVAILLVAALCMGPAKDHVRPSYEDARQEVWAAWEAFNKGVRQEDEAYWGEWLERAEQLVPVEQEDYIALRLKMALASHVDALLKAQGESPQLHQLRQRYPHASQIHALLSSLQGRPLSSVDEVQEVVDELALLLEERRLQLVRFDLGNRLFHGYLSRYLEDDEFLPDYLEAARAIHATLETPEMLALGCAINPMRLRMLGMLIFCSSYAEPAPVEAVLHYYALMLEGVEQGQFPAADVALHALEVLNILLEEQRQEEALDCYYRLLALGKMPQKGEETGVSPRTLSLHKVRWAQCLAASSVMLHLGASGTGDRAATLDAYEAIRQCLAGDLLEDAFMVGVADSIMLALDMHVVEQYDLFQELTLPQVLSLPEEEGERSFATWVTVSGITTEARERYFSLFARVFAYTLYQQEPELTRQMQQDMDSWPDEEASRKAREEIESLLTRWPD